MLSISRLRNHIAGFIILFYLISPLDNIWNFPIISSVLVSLLFLIILSLGTTELIRVLALNTIFISLTLLATYEISFYALKSSFALSFFFALLNKEFNLDAFLIFNYVKFTCIALFSLMLVPLFSNFNLILNALNQLNISYFFSKSIDLYEVNSVLKYQWIFETPTDAQSIFTGITLFIPFFIWIILSLYLKRDRSLTLFISFLPFVILYSRSSLLFLLLYFAAKKKEFRSIVLLGTVIFITYFTVSSYQELDQLLRGRDLIIAQMASEDIPFFGSGPGFWQLDLESQTGQGSVHNIFLEFLHAYGIFGTFLASILISLCYYKNKSSSLLLGLTYFISFGLFSFNLADIGFLGSCALLTKLSLTDKEFTNSKAYNAQQL